MVQIYAITWYYAIHSTIKSQRFKVYYTWRWGNAVMGATRLASGIVQLLFSGFCMSFLFIFPTRDASPPLEVALVGSVWCLSTVLLAIICKCTNTADAVALLFATLRRQPISILAYYHISTLPCSHHFALSLSASWSSYCFCRRTSSFIKRAVIFSVPGWP